MPARTGVEFDMLLFQEQPWQVMLDDVRYLERLGVGTLWVADHYAFPRRPSAPVLEAWTTLAALAVGTNRIRLGTLVSNVAMRHPAMLAKLAATVDRVSAGRVELGVGAGGGDGLYGREYDWLGIPPLSRGGRVSRLREAVDVIDALLREHHLTYHGQYYQLEEAPLVPEPVQQPRPPLHVAAHGARALKVVAQRADGWVSLGSPESASQEAALQALERRNQMLDECCSAIGRDPRSLCRPYYVGWAPGETPFASAQAFQDFVGRYQAAGVQRFVFAFVNDAGRGVRSAADGRYAGRDILDGFAARAMAELR